MKDFSLFEIADFVMDEDFIRWVHLRDEADNAAWENWLFRNPNKHLIVAEAKRIVESMGTGAAPVPPTVIDQEIDKLMRAIQVQSPPVSRTPKRMPVVLKYLAAAVIVTAIIGISIFTATRRENTSPRFTYALATSARQLIENVNTSSSTVNVPLPDSSVVKLYPNSRISYQNDFDSMRTRDVYLSGQASFSVKKNPHHPFRVFANEIITKVLGTSFTIRCYDKDTTIRVTVTEGKVSVYSQQGANVKESNIPNKLSGIIITPNQQLVYAKSTQEFEKVLLEKPVMINSVSVNKSMAYEDAPVDKVFDDLGHDYGINILYDTDLLKKCTVTADLANEPFYHKLDLICRAVGAHYEVIDAQVVIQATGCQ